MEPLTIFEAAHIVGLTPEKTRHVLQDHHLSEPDTNKIQASAEQLEELALEHYPWRAHIEDPQSYWVHTGQAAELLNLSTARVKQLLDQDRLPHDVHRSGVRLMRRAQIESIANAREPRDLS